MKKIILFIIFLIYPLSAFWGFCVGWSDYKIISYNNSELFSLKSARFYDIFLSWPFFKSNSISFEDNHSTSSAMDICKYKDFDKTPKLTYNNLIKEDKIKLIWNFLISILIILLFIYSMFTRYRKVIIVITLIALSFTPFLFLEK